jgi:hypothetical protein
MIIDKMFLQPGHTGNSLPYLMEQCHLLSLDRKNHFDDELTWKAGYQAQDAWPEDYGYVLPDLGIGPHVR